MKKEYKVGIVGIGTVGTELVKVLRHRKFPASEIRIIARTERDEVIAGETFHVHAASVEAFEGLKFALFAGTEGAKGASQQYGWPAVERGVVVIDNGDDYRMDPRVPLVIPEINPEALRKHQGVISNPNCSTIIALMALAPLHKVAKIRRFIASTYQSVSGTGRDALVELDQQARAYAAGGEMTGKVYPHRIAFNILPHIGGVKENGHTSEEIKMRNETRKILDAPEIAVCATCCRVPVFYSHSEVLNVEFEKPISPEQAREILAGSPGVKVMDDLSKAVYPMPVDMQGADDVAVGRIRKDETVPNGLTMFTVGDNIRKGAALNAVQIAEKMIEMGLA